MKAQVNDASWTILKSACLELKKLLQEQGTYIKESDLQGFNQCAERVIKLQEKIKDIEKVFINEKESGLINKKDGEIQKIYQECIAINEENMHRLKEGLNELRQEIRTLSKTQLYLKREDHSAARIIDKNI